MKNLYPILEFDHSSEAIINPSDCYQPIAMPEQCVLCFFNEVIQSLVSDGKAEVLTELRSEMGKHPVYKVNDRGYEFTLVHPGVGAPLAAGILEEVIALGGRKFIACGGAGVLDKEICIGHILVPYAAIRDEGVSYHYLPPAREVEINQKCLHTIKDTLEENKVKYRLIKTWTTDAFFRETRSKIQLRKEEGCLAVEMECAALSAVAEFRNVLFGQIIYGGDDVSCEKWDKRDWNHRQDIRENIFWMAVEACMKL